MYLTNVEGVCRRFCDEKKAKLGWVKDEIEKFKVREVLPDVGSRLLLVARPRLCLR